VDKSRIANQNHNQNDEKPQKDEENSNFDKLAEFLF
jgi:hypothetical protein